MSDKNIVHGIKVGNGFKSPDGQTEDLGYQPKGSQDLRPSDLTPPKGGSAIQPGGKSQQAEPPPPPSKS